MDLAETLQVAGRSTYKVLANEVTDEKKEAVGCLIEPAVAEPVAGHRAVRHMIWFCAGAAALVISALMIVPIGL